MTNKIRFYIIDTPFGYIVSTKRIVLKLNDNSEESQYKLFYKMWNINSEIIRNFYQGNIIGESDSDIFVISAMKCNCTCINWNEFLPQLVVFKKKNDAKKFKKVLEVRQILSTFTFLMIRKIIMKNMNLYIIDTPYGYMVAPKNLKFFGMTNSKEHQTTICYEMRTMSLKLAQALYKDKETGECMSNMFIADAVNNNCQLVEWNGDLLPIPCFLEKKDANSFKKILEARQVLCLMDE